MFLCRCLIAQVGEQGLQANATELVMTGGRVNLRHLREDVAFAAWRLRQHKATVQLPPELADLQPEVSWESVLIGTSSASCCMPATCASVSARRCNTQCPEAC
jgi:hypothetical protein